MFSLFKILFIPIILVSCSNYSEVNKSLTSTQTQLPSAGGTQMGQPHLKIKLHQFEFAPNFVNSQPKLLKEKTLIVPAIFYTGWHHITSYQSGRDTFTEDLESEFKEYLKQVLANHKIQFVDEGEDISFSLTIDSFESKLTYHKKGHFLMLLYLFSNHTEDYSTVDSKITGNLRIYSDSLDTNIPLASSYHAQNLHNPYPIDKIKMSLHHNLYDFSIKVMEELYNAQ